MNRVIVRITRIHVIVPEILPGGRVIWITRFHKFKKRFPLRNSKFDGNV